MRRLKKYLIQYNIDLLWKKKVLEANERRTLTLLLLAMIGKPLA